MFCSIKILILSPIMNCTLTCYLSHNRTAPSHAEPASIDLQYGSSFYQQLLQSTFSFQEDMSGEWDSISPGVLRTSHWSVMVGGVGLDVRVLRTSHWGVTEGGVLPQWGGRPEGHKFANLTIRTPHSSVDHHPVDHHPTTTQSTRPPPRPPPPPPPDHHPDHHSVDHHPVDHHPSSVPEQWCRHSLNAVSLGHFASPLHLIRPTTVRFHSLFLTPQAHQCGGAAVPGARDGQRDRRVFPAGGRRGAVHAAGGGRGVGAHGVRALPALRLEGALPGEAEMIRRASRGGSGEDFQGGPDYSD